MVSSKYIRFQEKVTTGQSVAKFIEQSSVSEYHKNINDPLYQEKIESKKVLLPKNEFTFSVGGVVEQFNPFYGYGSFTLSYHKRNKIKNWFWFGFCSVDIHGQDRFGYYRYFSIAPSMRFSYLNKPKVTLYSGLSLGIGILTGSAWGYFPFFQITPIGFSYGKRFFVGSEFGYGLKGTFCANTGYKW
ncbi:MAG: hypothetical protein FWH18_07895 [Marinilabiliaceae bacterium]|nr:hypothetical protein [Marinilabiliaceae bacterium]